MSSSFRTKKNPRAKAGAPAATEYDALSFAAENMPHGLAMFDANGRLVVCNARYIQMYSLDRTRIQRGLPLKQLLKERSSCGTFSGNIEDYCGALLRAVAHGETSSNTTTVGRRTIQVVNRPLPGGGWVATHEDVTTKAETEKALARQKDLLSASLENMSQGVCMFNAQRQLIVCNKQYAELYGLSEEETAPGTTLEKILSFRVSKGAAPENYQGYIHDRLAEVASNREYKTVNRLMDGRYISISHRPIRGGGWVATHEDVTQAQWREDSFRLLFDANPVPMWLIDKNDLQFLAVNEAALVSYGYSQQQFLSMKLPDLLLPEDRQRLLDAVNSAPNDTLYSRELKHRRADGAILDVLVYARTLTYAGRVARLAAIHDVTQLKNVENELTKTKKFLDTIVDHVPLPIVVKRIDPARNEPRYELVNKAYEELTGETRGKLLKKTAHDIYPADRAAVISSTDLAALHGEGTVKTTEHEIDSPRGRRLVTAKKTAITHQDTVQYVLTVLDDITERTQVEKRISYLAHHDPLTGLHNRASFVEFLGQKLDEATKSSDPFAVFCLDLDRFKEANDTYGHLVGDEILRAAASRLAEAAEENFIARIGGDEFIVVCANTDNVGPLSKRLIAALNEPVSLHPKTIQIGVTAGVALYPDHGTDSTTLIANADAALYEAKMHRRGSVKMFEPALGVRLREKRELGKDIPQALSSGQFELYYQPQFSIRENKVVGQEALVRWNHPQYGVIGPNHFIGIAEQNGVIEKLGEMILREACTHAKACKGLKVAVNVSPAQFYRGDLVNLVHSVLLETGLTGSCLELEITEGILIDDFSRAMSILRRLKALGISIAMDDFGKGYSSLSYLHAFPFDKIKIDRQFIADIDSNHHSQAIVKAVLTLGKSLAIPVCAEGVETEMQKAILVEAGVDEIQGFLIGRPLSASALWADDNAQTALD